MKTHLLFLALLAFVTAHTALAQEKMIEIDADFPGGNIIVDPVDTGTPVTSTLYHRFPLDQDTIHLRPDFRDTHGHWFYWCFRVNGAEGKTLNFQFDRRRFAAFGPAYSTDGGNTWQWLQDKPHEGTSFSYTFSEDETEVYFSVGMPYLEDDFEDFIQPYLEHPHLSVGSLATTAKGRNVEKLVIHNDAQPAKHKAIITARHHACEMMASYVLEGLIAALLSDDPDMVSLREDVEFLIVPFMDKDGVQDGDQGKNRRPYDHNRDYAVESIYTSTAAIREKATSWGEGKLRVGLDLHCPYLLGKGHVFIHFVGSSDEATEAEQLKFSKILEAHQKGELTYKSDSFLKFGEFWNVGGDPGQKNFANFISSVDGVTLATTIEVPYAINYDQQVTPENARQFGRNLATALAVYLQDLDQ